MVRIKKKKKQTGYRSVNGDRLNCLLDAREKCLNVKVSKDLGLGLRLRMALLLTTVSVNLACLYFDVLHVRIVATMFCVTTVLFFKLCRHIREERLTAVKGLGVQLTAKYLFGSEQTFIPQEWIQRIFINEVIFEDKVMFLLMMMISDKNQTKDKLVPVFLETLPRLSLLKTVYTALRRLNYTSS